MPFTSGLKPKVRELDVVLLGGVLLLTRKRSLNWSLESLSETNPDSPSECNETAQTSLARSHIGGAAIVEPLTKLRRRYRRKKAGRVTRHHSCRWLEPVFTRAHHG